MARVWVENTVAMKAAHPRSAANTQVEANRQVRLKVQLAQKTAKASFQEVIPMAPDMILGTAYIKKSSRIQSQETHREDYWLMSYCNGGKRGQRSICCKVCGCKA